MASLDVLAPAGLSARITLACPSNHPLTVVVPPALGVVRTVRAARALDRECWCWSEQPSAVQAAVVLAAGADSYCALEPDLLGLAFRCARGPYLDAAGAAGLLQLCRLVSDRSFDTLAAVARATATGTPWERACRASNVSQPRKALRGLRAQL